MSSARELFYPPDKKFNRHEERAFAREELIYNVTEDILLAMENRKVTQQELARRLGKSRSFVSQVLNGTRNMTLGSLSDICFALDLKPRVQIDQGECRNRSTPLIKIAPNCEHSERRPGGL